MRFRIVDWESFVHWLRQRFRFRPQRRERAVSLASPIPQRTRHKAPAQPAAAPAARHTHGYPCLLPTQCQPLAAIKDDAWPATVRTLRRNGLKLVLKRRFEPGTVLKFDLENPAQCYSRTFFARVTIATAQGGGEWALDCALSGECDDDEVKALLS